MVAPRKVRAMNFISLPFVDFVQAMTSVMAPDFRSRRDAPVHESLRPIRRRSR